MSDYLMREFSAQLSTSMDTVLSRAVFEIMGIFENSLHDHQIELGQKGEEVAQLKMKLHRAEIRLSEIELGGDRGMEFKKGRTEDVLSAPEQTADVPEIDFEVPDDWCAPLGCETATKQGDLCPSVRLRRLSIPLWPISLIKQQVVQRDIDPEQRANVLRRTRRNSSLNERHKPTQDKTLPTRGQETRVRNDMKELLQGTKQEYTDITSSTVLRSRGRNLTGKEQENTKKSKSEERKIAATESDEKVTVKRDGEKKYCCKFCKKLFDTMFGRSVHVRSHRKCQGCKREFPYPSFLKVHKTSCKELKQLLAKKAQSTNHPNPESCDEKNPTASSRKQVIAEKKGTPSSGNHSESSIQKDGRPKNQYCVHCNKIFHNRWKLKEHERIHTGETPYTCSMCPKKFRINQSLKKHKMRIHKDQMKSSGTNKNHARTKPLEKTEDNREDLNSPRKDRSRAIHHNDVQRDRSPDISPSSKWQTMGKRCPNGFICLLCQKLSKNMSRLIEHFRTHTGEKPLKCDQCSAKFRSHGQLSKHKKGCCNPKQSQCAKCKKKYYSQNKYNRHVLNCNRDHSCKVCGKGFFTKGRLGKHMERFHN
ncbi:zinc finger protein 62 homolog [Cottoperca gobio]|uniref:Zinc finger protein 62 homolog n=1 Tax=Cottoperca gobio TaxID=56716 RepID=A0A6J2QL08_COTGO|nr:zinc finger protein 62 homolog [Cottoperca gobio]XP_029298008.1 zinc finger protein 62 homolog [Cottoperca gobio]XP_029298010.1 zinc finger protein 62 homolog [Cottoperca gobio]